MARTVRAERTARGWTQARLAAESGMSARGVSDLEAGARAIKLDDLVPLCRALGVTLPVLLARVSPEDRQVLGI